MNQFLPFIVIGLATGAVYGLAGMGLVLTYKTSGIFNFGYGAVAALVVFLFYLLYAEHGVPWPAAAAICLLVAAPVLGLALELLARSLDGATETVKVVATVGLILIVEAIGSLWNPVNPPTFPHFLSQSTVRILGVNVTWEQIILFVFSLIASAVLYWFFRSLRLGVLMRGVVDNNELVSMSGDDPVRVRRWAWVIGTMFASVAGLMLAPTQSLDGVTLTTAVFAAFGAAAIGYFTNLPLTFVGGLLIGIAGALVDKYSATITWIGGLPPSLPFIILFVVLIVMPRRRLVQRRVAVLTHTRRAYHAPVRVRLSVGAVVVALLAIVPVVQATHLSVWSAALVDIILLQSLGLLVRRSGQISLCHLAFAAVGAATFGHFAGDGMPWLLALVLATLVAVPVGALISIPAVRVSGVFLALATLGFGIVMEQVFYTRSFMFGSSAFGIADPRPDVSIGAWNLSTDSGFYYLLLIVTVLVVLTVTAISNGRLGRLLEALADSPLALETHGATSSVLKVIVFCIAAAMASLAGAFSGMLFHYSIGSDFVSFNSLTLVALVVIVTIGDPWYAVIGAIGYTVIPGYVSGQTTSTLLLLAVRPGLGHRRLRNAARYHSGGRAGVPGPPGRPEGGTGPGPLGGAGCARRQPSRGAGSRAGGAGRAGRPRPVRPVRWREGGGQRHPDGAGGCHHGLDRAEWCREDDPLQCVQRHQPSHLGPDTPARCGRQPPGLGAPSEAGSRAHLPAPGALQQPDGAAEHRHGKGGRHRRAAIRSPRCSGLDAPAGWWPPSRTRRSSSPGRAASPTPRWGCSPSARGAWSSWPERWPARSICCSSTSPRRGSMFVRPSSSDESSRPLCASAAAASCWSSMT